MKLLFLRLKSSLGYISCSTARVGCWALYFCQHFFVLKTCLQLFYLLWLAYLMAFWMSLDLLLIPITFWGLSIVIWTPADLFLIPITFWGLYMVFWIPVDLLLIPITFWGLYIVFGILWTCSLSLLHSGVSIWFSRPLQTCSLSLSPSGISIWFSGWTPVGLFLIPITFWDLYMDF